MKSLLSKSAILTLVLILVAGIVAASPSSADVADSLISTGSMNALIGSLLNRDDPASYHLLSRAYYAIEQWDEAVRTGERAVTLKTGDSNYHLWLGRAYGQKAEAAINPLSAANLARKAKNEFERAVQLDPANVPARADLSEYYTEAPTIMGGGTEKARSQASQVEKVDPATANWIRAIVAQKEKRYDEAESAYKSAIATAQSPAQYWMNLASFYRDRGRLDDMETTIQTAVAQPNLPPITYYDAASELFQGGRNFPAAVQYLQKYLASGEMVEDAPGFRAHYLLGQIYQKSGNKAQAVAEYQASLSLASGFDRARKALDQLQ